MATGIWQRWLRRLENGVRNSAQRQVDRRRTKRTRLSLEKLEDRTVPANFTAGNIAVMDLATTSNNTTGSILELNPSTANQSTPVQTITIAATGTNPMRFSDSGTSSFLSDTNDGTLLTFAGYNTTDSTDSDLSVVTANDPASDRAVGTLDSGGNFTLQTTYTGVSGDQARSATSLDDSHFFITDKGGLYTNNASSASNTTNILNARSFGGTVYVSSTKASAGVSTVSSPTATTLSGLPGLSADGSIQDFYLIQSGSNGSTYDILYTLDQNKSSATINKFSLVGGTWVSNGSFVVASNATSMIAENDGNGAYLYVVTTAQAADNSVVRLTDSSSWVNSSTPTTGFTLTNSATLYTATGTSTLKGIAFVPVASATTASVTTSAPASVGINSATLGGTVTSTGSPGAISYGVVYSLTNSNPTIGGAGVAQIAGSGTPAFSPFTVSATGLQGTSTYYYAAYATNSTGTSYGSVLTFTTQSANAPTVDTPTDASITNTSAVLGATVESNGGAQITKTGIVYALSTANNNPQIGGSGVTEVDTNNPVNSGAFTVSAAGLTPGASYTFEAFATNSSGTTYTAATTFTTLAPPTVSTPTEAAITSSSATLGGNVVSDGGSTVTKRGVVYAPTALDSNPQLNDGTAIEVDASGTTGAFTVPVTGLSPSTSYTFEAFATNSFGTTYTTATTFTTAAPGVITAWTFPTTAGAPDNSPAPTYGTGTATTLGMTNSYTNASGTGNTASDDVLSTSGTANPNFTENLWRVRGTPNNGWALAAPEYSQGIELDTSTVGYSNIVFAFDWYSTTQGIRDLQVQYNTGSGWVNYQGPSSTGTFVATSDDYYNSALSPANPTIYINLSNVAAANNNPDLGIRLVSAYDSTGTLGDEYASAASTPGNIIPYNNSSGNWRFGNLTFYGNITTTTTTLSASPAGSQDYGQNATFTATVTPASGTQFPSGTVNFYDGATLLGSQSVTQVGTSNVGTAALTLSTLSPGVHGDITAQYVPAASSGMIASGSSMNLTVGENPISYVINAPQATGVDVSPVVGQSFTGVVATFSDGLDTNPNDFQATINWGDGQTSSGVIAYAGTNNVTNINGATVPVMLFTVTGTNTYAAAGSYPLSVTITDPDNNSVTVNPSARVGYPPLLVTAGPAVNAVAGNPLNNVTVATFTDPGLVANLAALGISDPTTQFSASINWGDSSPAATGAISYNSATQTFSVLGSHTYSQTGSYSISVAVTPTTVSVERTDSSDPNDLNEVGDEDDNGLTDSPSPDFIDQYVIGATNQAGSLYTFSLPTVATSSGNEALTNSSYSRSEGELSLSTNGQYLVTGGYNSTVDLWGPQSTYSSASAVNRVIATVNGVGDINTTTALTDAYSGDNFRGVVSTDGTQFWTAGHSTDSSDYVHYAQLGVSTSTIITGPSEPDNINTVEIFNGQLYEGVRSASGAPAGIYQIGTGLPTTGGQSQTLFIETPQSNPLNVTDSDDPSSPNGFYMADLNDGNPTINGVNVAFVADTEMGIARYDYTSSGWQFSYYINSTGAFLNSAYTVDSDGNVTPTSSFNSADPAASADPTKAGGVRELTGRVVNGQVQLFAITGFGTGSEPNPGESLIELTDTGANSGYTTLATDTGASVFTGVAFTPSQTVTSNAAVDAITQNPTSRNINAGQTVHFSAATANPAGTDTVQWQVSTDGGHSFTPLSDGGVYSGSATNTLTITNAPASLNSAEYVAVFTTGGGTLTTTAATLTVDSVTTNPSNAAITYGQSASFSAATQNPTATDTVQWEVSSDGGATLTPLSDGGVYSGTQTSTLNITDPSVAYSGDEYEAVFTNSAGTLTTSPALLTVSKASQTINFPPLAPIIFAPNETVNLTATGGASGNAVVFTIDSSSTGAGTLNGNVLTVARAGKIVLDAKQAGNDNYNAASQVQQTLTVVGPGATLVGSTLYLVGGANTNDQVQISSSGSSVIVSGTLNGAKLSGTYPASAIYFVGYKGNESIVVANTVAVPVTIIAGDGSDDVQLGNSNSTVTLGNGNDNVTAGNGNNIITVGNGNDNVTAGNGSNTVTAGGGNDNFLLGNGNYNTLTVTGNGNDNVTVGNGSYDAVSVVGNGNHNILLGSGAHNTLKLRGSGHNNVTQGEGWTDI